MQISNKLLIHCKKQTKPARNIPAYKEEKEETRLVMPLRVAERAEMDSFVDSRLYKIVAFPARNVNLANVRTILTQHITE